MGRWTFRCISVLALIALHAMASAHDLGLTLIALTGDRTGTTVRLVTPISALTEREELTPVEVSERVRLRLDLWERGRSVQIRNATLTLDPKTDLLTYQGRLTSPVDQVEVRHAFDPRLGTRTILTIKRPGKPVDERLLKSSGEGVRRSSPAPLTFMQDGVLHILSGPDHIAFVIGLVFLGGTLGSLVKRLTAFTLAHAVTLALAATRQINLPSSIVEPLIALTIVAIAIEGLRHHSEFPTKETPWQWPIVFAFGLVHGLGFASGFAQLALSQAISLAGVAFFNLGIELGQLAVLGVTATLIWAWERAAKGHKSALRTFAMVLIGMAGTFWFFQRIP